MEEEVYFYTVHDKALDKWHTYHTPAALDYIEQTPLRRAIEGSARSIDTRLLDGERRALFGPYSDEAKLLQAFAGGGGALYEPEDVDPNEHPLAPLLKLRLVRTQLVDDRLEFRITELGYLALDQLLKPL